MEKIICNMCANDIKINDYGYYENYIKIEKRWGYGSCFDNQDHSFIICEHCYKRELVAKAKLKPIFLNIIE
ncbi:MAG: hypothetical protein FWF57_06790 [Defluviitaleaceae bacterium]|nr:hypothetical protein [Defluviitaleaceae bacterium]